jgi:hypothetical protein
VDPARNRPESGDRIAALIPNITLVEVDTMAFQEFSNLLLKREFPMMFGLLLNIHGHGLDVRFTNRKSSVTVLPSKIENSLLFETF